MIIKPITKISNPIAKTSTERRKCCNPTSIDPLGVAIAGMILLLIILIVLSIGYAMGWVVLGGL